jgi:hypothetical protein
MTENFLPPEPQNEPNQGDLLEQLLVVAAEKAAKKEAQDALTKGFVTRGDINAALSAFGASLEDRIAAKIADIIMPQVETAVQKTVEATPGLRKSTIATPEDERDADPVKYILKKSREQGAESLDEAEKRVVWALTYKALGKGLEDAGEEEE